MLLQSFKGIGKSKNENLPSKKLERNCLVLMITWGKHVIK